MLKISRKEEYSKYRFDWENVPKICKVTRFPIHIDLELTSRCNLSCSFCPFHSIDAPFRPEEPYDMDFELFKKIIDEGSKKGLKAIKLNYRGEPLLYDLLPEAIEYAKKAGILDVQLNTNAVLMTKELSKKLIIAGLDLLLVSDYDLNSQVKNVIYMHTIKELHGRDNPKVSVYSERPERWRFIVDEVIEPITYDYHNIVEVFDKSEFKCEYPWLRFLVMADGSVMSCSCGTVYVEKFIGNAWNWDLEDLWLGKEMQFLRMCHESRKSELARICRLCPMRNLYIERCKENL